jgi:hypothetical protein
LRSIPIGFGPILLGLLLGGCAMPLAQEASESGVLAFNASYLSSSGERIELDLTGPSQALDWDLSLHQAYSFAVRFPDRTGPLQHKVFALDGRWKIGNVVEPCDVALDRCTHTTVRWDVRGHPAPFFLNALTQVDDDSALRFRLAGNEYSIPVDAQTTGDSVVVTLERPLDVVSHEGLTWAGTSTFTDGRPLPDEIQLGGGLRAKLLTFEWRERLPAIPAWESVLDWNRGNEQLPMFAGAAQPVWNDTPTPEELFRGFLQAVPEANAFYADGCLTNFLLAGGRSGHLGIDEVVLTQSYSFEVRLSTDREQRTWSVERQDTAGGTQYVVQSTRDWPEVADCESIRGIPNAATSSQQFLQLVTQMQLAHVGAGRTFIFATADPFRPVYTALLGPEQFAVALQPSEESVDSPGGVASAYFPYVVLFWSAPGVLDRITLHPDDVDRLTNGGNQS